MTRRITVDLPETDAARQAHQWLKSMAKADGRSMGQEVVFLIKEAAQKRGLASKTQEATKMLKWSELIVTDTEGNQGTLGALVAEGDAGLRYARVRNGQITEWEGYFLSAPGEEPDADTPHVPVDWTGFALPREA